MESNIPTTVLSLTAEQAGVALQISQRKLWSMTVSGDLPHVRIGKSLRYPVNERKKGG